MPRIRVSPLLWLIVFSYMLIEGSFNPLLVLLFSLLHELGHLLAIRRCGVPVRLFSGGGAGFALRVSGLSYRCEVQIALAGPLANIALAALFAAAGALSGSAALWFCCYSNLALAALNLLPVYPLDGGRVLSALIAPHCSPQLHRRIVCGVRLACLLPMLALAFLQFLRSGYNLSLLLVCISLFALIGDQP